MNSHTRRQMDQMIQQRLVLPYLRLFLLEPLRLRLLLSQSLINDRLDVPINLLHRPGRTILQNLE